MRVSEIKAAFPTEAALCDCFMASLKRIGGWTAYPETAGFDILAVYDKTGHQLGIEAKLHLNAKVADQILPASYARALERGPDFRAVIVPAITEASHGIARLLAIVGVQCFAPRAYYDGLTPGWAFDDALGGGLRRDLQAKAWDEEAAQRWPWRDLAWHDWNPVQRCELPEIVPTVRAGVPAPLQLTPWKIGALKVLADLELDGFVTAKSVRDRGVDARRFCASDGWLEQLGGGRWGRGRIPAFDQQHPEAYAEILAAARAEREAAKP